MKKFLTIIALVAIPLLTWAATDRQLDAVTITNQGVTITLPTSAGTLVDEAGTQTLTNKSMSGASNTFTLIDLTSSVTGALPIANGGTGQVTAQAAIDALLPAQGAANGQFLTSDGTNSSWAAVPAAGATTELDNLGTTAIGGVALIGTGTVTGNANGASDIGSTTVSYGSGYFDNVRVARSGSGSAWFYAGGSTLNGQITGIGTPTPSGVSAEMVVNLFNGAGRELAIITQSVAAETNPILIETGNSTANSGKISLVTGTSSATRGKIEFIDGSQGTDGHVWTQVGTGGAGNWEAAPMASPNIGGTRAAPTAITAVGGITAGTGYVQIQFVEGSAGPIDITANPQISAGANVGELMSLVGRNATNTLTLDDGTGLSLNGQIILGLDSVINLMWDGTNWLETSRR